MADEENKEITQAEKIAESAVKNPTKTLFWVLLIAIITLSSVITYIYKTAADDKNKDLTICYEDRKALIDSICNVQKQHNLEIKNIYYQQALELNKRIEKQELINEKNLKVILTNKNMVNEIKTEKNEED